MNTAWLRAMELEMQRQALISLLVLIVVFIVATWASYHVLKAAIRDGIRESGLVQQRGSWANAVQRATRESDTDPDFKASR